MAKLKNPITLELFRELLKANHLKATPQRLAVHKAMLELGHASADMIALKLKDEDGKGITVSSIYNILSQLSILGIYKRRLSATNKMFFDVNREKHIHLYDTFNNNFRDIVDDELMTIVEDHLRDKKYKGFKIDTIDIQILCHPSHRKSPLSF